jgi:hypothetical protein
LGRAPTEIDQRQDDERMFVGQGQRFLIVECEVRSTE